MKQTYKVSTDIIRSSALRKCGRTGGLTIPVTIRVGNPSFAEQVLNGSKSQVSRMITIIPTKIRRSMTIASHVQHPVKNPRL